MAVGEVVTYQIEFGLADGVTAAASLRDVLQSGMSFMPGTATLARSRDGITIAADPGGINGAPAGTPVAVAPVVSGTDITLALGDVTVTPSPLPATLRARIPGGGGERSLPTTPASRSGTARR